MKDSKIFMDPFFYLSTILFGVLVFQVAQIVFGAECVVV